MGGLGGSGGTGKGGLGQPSCLRSQLSDITDLAIKESWDTALPFHAVRREEDRAKQRRRGVSILFLV